MCLMLLTRANKYLLAGTATPNDFVDAYHRQQASSQGNGGQAKGNGDSNKSTNTSQQKPMTASGGTGAEGESEGYDEYPSEEDVLDEL